MSPATLSASEPAVLADGEGPKYLNSPDSALYEKSRALYGLHRAKSHIVTAGASVVCEGYLDVIGAAAADISTAVASCGTALGSEHLQLLGRFADRVVLAFDADTAGAKAAARLHHLEAQQKLTLAVATLPSGTDPGDLGFTAPDQLRQCIDDAKPLMTFLVDRAAALHAAVRTLVASSRAASRSRVTSAENSGASAIHRATDRRDTPPAFAASA